jgi:hypothetical protein
MQLEKEAVNRPDNLILRGWLEMNATKTTGYEKPL